MPDAEVDPSGASRSNEDARNRPEAAQNMLEHVDERAEQLVHENSPGTGKALDKQEAGMSVASSGDKDPRHQPKKLQKVSEDVSKQPGQRVGENSPDSSTRARGIGGRNGRTRQCSQYQGTSPMPQKRAARCQGNCTTSS